MILNAGLCRTSNPLHVMNKTSFSRVLVTGLLLCLLSACATYPGNLRAGMTRAEVLSRFGSPVAQRKDETGEVVIYSTAPFGQFAYAARFGPDDRVRDVEQVLREDKFARIEIGVWDIERVRGNFGTPAEVRNMPDGRSWWGYRYKQNGVWEMLMNVLFDAQGKVRQLINTPDPMYERNDPWW